MNYYFLVFPHYFGPVFENNNYSTNSLPSAHMDMKFAQYNGRLVTEILEACAAIAIEDGRHQRAQKLLNASLNDITNENKSHAMATDCTRYCKVYLGLADVYDAQGKNQGLVTDSISMDTVFLLVFDRYLVGIMEP